MSHRIGQGWWAHSCITDTAQSSSLSLWLKMRKVNPTYQHLIRKMLSQHQRRLTASNPPTPNQDSRIIAGCMKLIPIDKISCLVGIAPSDVWREVTANHERLQASTLNAHPLLSYHPIPATLKIKFYF